MVSPKDGGGRAACFEDVLVVVEVLDPFGDSGLGRRRVVTVASAACKVAHSCRRGFGLEHRDGG